MRDARFVRQERLGRLGRGKRFADSDQVGWVVHLRRSRYRHLPDRGGSSPKLLVGKNTIGTVNGSTRGVSGTNLFELTISDGETGTGYNFGIRGPLASQVSLRMFLASTYSVTSLLEGLYNKPSVSLSGSSSSPNYTTTYSTRGASTAITSSTAYLSSVDSATLVSMTISDLGRPRHRL